MAEWLFQFFAGNWMSDAAAVFVAFWVAATVIFALASVLQRQAVVCAHALLVVMTDSQIALRWEMASFITKMTVFRLLSAPESVTETGIVKAQEITEGIPARSFEKQAIADSVGQWVASELNQIDNVPGRQSLVDGLAEVIAESKVKRGGAG